MKRLFTSFFKRNLAAAKLAVQSQLEYRVNFTIDALIQPVLTAAIEVIVWMTIVKGIAGGSLGGFGPEFYLAYAMWAQFVGRITTNWMYEYNMLEEIESGTVNAILVRPLSFYEFYLFQFVSYKMLCAVASLFIPVVGCWLFSAPLHIERIPIVVVQLVYYLVFVHTLSFCIACLAFFIHRAFAFVQIKNLAIWVLAGEMIPLDLYPEPFRSWLIHSPFSSGVYMPVSYLTGRISWEVYSQSFTSITMALGLSGVGAFILWRLGVRSYVGTGA